MDYGFTARARHAAARTAHTANVVHPTLIRVVTRHLAGDLAGSRELVLGLRTRGESESLGAFLWMLACTITIWEQGKVTPDPDVPYDRDACEFINHAAPLVEGSPMPLLHSSLAGDLLDRKWFHARDEAFAAFIERVLSHAARYPDRLVAVMAGEPPAPDG